MTLTDKKKKEVEEINKKWLRCYFTYFLLASFLYCIDLCDFKRAVGFYARVIRTPGGPNDRFVETNGGSKTKQKKKTG